MVDTVQREDVILKPNGNKITRRGIVNEGESFYEEQYQEKLSDICDFSEGSEIRTLHESFAVELFSLYKEMFRTAKMKFVLDSENTYLDRLGCEVHLRRKKATVATGNVTFSTDETITGQYTIPAGTVILSRYKGYEYVLDENVILESSSTPKTGTVHSKLTGAAYNTEADTLTAFQDINSIRKNIKVTNNTPITGGEDGESDESFKRRILNAKKEKSWGTALTYSNFIKEKVSGVHDVQFVDPNVLKLDETLPAHYKPGTNTVEIEKEPSFDTRIKSYCTDCTRVLFVNGTMKPVTTEILDEVDDVMTRQNNLVIGQTFHVQEVEIVPVCFKIDLYCTADVPESTIFTHLTAFFDGGTVETKVGEVEYPGLEISDSVYKYDLLNVLENIPGVMQCVNISELKYDSSIKNNNVWNDNGDNSYTYTDDDGFSFNKTTIDQSTINCWGERNFTQIDCNLGQVLNCVAMKDLDEDSTGVFILSETVVSS